MTDTPLSILIAGSSGFIGTPLQRALRDAGHRVSTLVRREPSSASEVRWAPGKEPLDPGVLDDVDVVINLAGASIARLPWTSAYKPMLLSSRIDATTTLVDAIRASDRPPQAFLSGSASGYYGDRPVDVLDERAAAGSGFLADLASAWETAALEAPDGVRTVLLRTGLVIGPGGGALAPLVPLTRFGLGARLGTGGQFWPWISLADEVGAIVHLCTADVSGPVNLAGPSPSVSDRITRHVAKVLRRPYLFSLPGALLHLVLGEAAEELLLANQRMVPDVLQASGYVFRHDHAEEAINAAFADA